MSGVSLAVGQPRDAPGQIRRGDPELPQERAKHHEFVRGLMGWRTIELQLVAFIIVFSASGLVPLVDLLFPVLVTAYVLILSRFVFPSPPIVEGTDYQLEVFHGSRMFHLYKALGIVIGLFLPLAYVLGAFARGDQRAVRAATPHLFLLSAQVLSENLIRDLAFFTPPARVILTLLYSTRRIFTLCTWVSEEFSTASPFKDSRLQLLNRVGLHRLGLQQNVKLLASQDFLWVWFGRWLALANFTFFIVNMFCFLIPRFLPRAFERYLAAKGSPHQSIQLTDRANPPISPKQEIKGKEKEQDKKKSH